MQEEFRDAMTENAALEGEVSQLTYEVSLNLFRIGANWNTVPIDYSDTLVNLEKCQ